MRTPLKETIRQLWAMGHSPAARKLRDVFAELRAELERGTSDPGSELASSLCEHIAELTQAGAKPEECSLVMKLKQVVESDARLAQALGKIELKSQSFDAAWSETQELLLGVDDNRSRVVRAGITSLLRDQGATLVEDPERSRVLALGKRCCIYPAVTGSANALGLYSPELSNIHPKLLQPIPKSLQAAAEVVSVWLQRIHTDEHQRLHHALESIGRFKTYRLSGEQRENYPRELIRRFNRLQKLKQEGSDARSEVLAWIALDEAIYSLIPALPEERQSFWGGLKERSRRVLLDRARSLRQCGLRLKIQPLWDNYQDALQHSGRSDLGLDTQGHRPGTIIICLRVYADIDGEKRPGRVIYQS